MTPVRGITTYMLRTTGLEPKAYPSVWTKVKCEHRVSPEGKRVSKVVTPAGGWKGSS